MNVQSFASAGRALALAVSLSAAAPAVHAQARLVQTIDLGKWTGVPVSIVQPPPPLPAHGFSLTGIAFNPTSNTLFVSDYATTNVYAISGATNTVSSAVYTNGLFSSADIGATQNLPGTAPKSVLVNPATDRWLFMGQGGGAQFSGTTLAEGVNAQGAAIGRRLGPDHRQRLRYGRNRVLCGEQPEVPLRRLSLRGSEQRSCRQPDDRARVRLLRQ